MLAFNSLISMKTNAINITKSFHSNKPSLPATIKLQSDADLALSRRVIYTHGESKNLVISPLSIHTLLAMTAAGSSGRNLAQLLSYLNSESSEQLNSLFSGNVKTVLADGSPSGGPLLSTANGLWVDQSVNLMAAYRDIVENFYNAAAECVDFQNQAFIEVNERGTEAAAVTAAVRKPPPLEFVADHLFVLVIREDTTGELLFVGQLLDPLANASF